MIRKSVLVVALIASISGHALAQKIFFTRNGHVEFFSSTPMENIQATNDKVTSIMNITTGDIEFSVLSMAFQFEKALMQEHFNENYMESSKFPKSTFKGRIVNLDKIDFTRDGSYPAEVSGDLTIHGVTRPVTAAGTFLVQDGKFRAEAVFTVKPADHKIEIPNLVRDKIASEIKVSVSNQYEPFNK